MTAISPDERFGDGDNLEATLDPLDETLVSYLDGELSAAERAKIEQRLVNDPALRARLQELQGGWELLDELPSARVDDHFTHTTMEMVAAETLKEIDRWSTKDLLRRSLRPLLVVLATLACLALGALFVHVSRRAELQRQLNDLPIAEHLDGYLTVHDLDWLRALAENERWLETIRAAEAADVFGPAGLPATDSAFREAEGMQRAKVIEQMPPDEKEQLLADWQRLQRLPEQRREEVRRVAAEIEADPRRGQLLRTADAFARWREALPADLQDALHNAIASGSEKERTAALQAGIEYSQRLWLRDSGRQLSDRDAEAIYEAMYAIASGWREQLEALQEEGQDDSSDRDSLLTHAKALAKNDPADRFEDVEGAMLHIVFVRFRGFRGPPGDRGDRAGAGANVGRLTDDDFYLLKAVLADETREILDTLAPTVELQQETLMRWVRESVERKTGRANSTRLEKLQALDRDDRQRVELSEPDDLFQRLEQHYRREQWERFFTRPSSEAER